MANNFEYKIHVSIDQKSVGSDVKQILSKMKAEVENGEYKIHLTGDPKELVKQLADLQKKLPNIDITKGLKFALADAIKDDTEKGKQILNEFTTYVINSMKDAVSSIDSIAQSISKTETALEKLKAKRKELLSSDDTASALAAFEKAEKRFNDASTKFTKSKQNKGKFEAAEQMKEAYQTMLNYQSEANKKMSDTVTTWVNNTEESFHNADGKLVTLAEHMSDMKVNSSYKKDLQDIESQILSTENKLAQLRKDLENAQNPELQVKGKLADNFLTDLQNQLDELTGLEVKVKPVVDKNEKIELKVDMKPTEESVNESKKIIKESTKEVSDEITLDNVDLTNIESVTKKLSEYKSKAESIADSAQDTIDKLNKFTGSSYTLDRNMFDMSSTLRNWKKPSLSANDFKKEIKSALESNEKERAAVLYNNLKTYFPKTKATLKTFKDSDFEKNYDTYLQQGESIVNSLQLEPNLQSYRKLEDVIHTLSIKENALEIESNEATAELQNQEKVASELSKIDITSQDSRNTALQSIEQKISDKEAEMQQMLDLDENFQEEYHNLAKQHVDHESTQEFKELLEKYDIPEGKGLLGAVKHLANQRGDLADEIKTLESMRDTIISIDDASKSTDKTQGILNILKSANETQIAVQGFNDEVSTPPNTSGQDKIESKLEETKEAAKETKEAISEVSKAASTSSDTTSQNTVQSELEETKEKANETKEAVMSFTDKLEYLKNIKSESKFLETADEKRMDMEEKAWDAGGNNPKSEADSLKKIQAYESLVEHIETAEDALSEFNSEYEKVIITFKNGEKIEIFDPQDLENISLAKKGIQDIEFVANNFTTEPIDSELEETAEVANETAETVEKVNQTAEQSRNYDKDLEKHISNASITRPDYEKFNNADYNQGKKELEQYYNRVIELQEKLDAFSSDHTEQEIKELEDELYDAELEFMAAYQVLNDYSDYRLSKDGKHGGAKQNIQDLYGDIGEKYSAEDEEDFEKILDDIEEKKQKIAQTPLLYEETSGQLSMFEQEAEAKRDDAAATEELAEAEQKLSSVTPGQMSLDDFVEDSSAAATQSWIEDMEEIERRSQENSERATRSWIEGFEKIDSKSKETGKGIKEALKNSENWFEESDSLELLSVELDKVTEAKRKDAEATKELANAENSVSKQKTISESESTQSKQSADKIVKDYKEILSLESRIQTLKKNGATDDNATVQALSSRKNQLIAETDALKQKVVVESDMKRVVEAETAANLKLSEAETIRNLKEQQATEALENNRASLLKTATALTTNGKLMREYGNQINALIEEIRSDNITAERLAQIRIELNKIVAEANAAQKSGKSMFQIFKQRAASLVAYLGTFASFYRIASYVRTAITTIIDLDTQLVDLRKTTTMNTKELKNFYNASSDVAKELGVTTSEIISQAAAWSRLGYSTQEAATEMAKLSSKFTSISPGVTSDNATDYLVSTMQAYGIAVDDVERKIMDNVNAIGNSFATTNGEIGEMLTRSSAAMKAANNTLEQTIALEAAAVEVTRNAETTGTAFRTISMRIRGKQSLPPYSENYMLCA